MNMNTPIDDILGSKSKVRILRLLFLHPAREYTEREIAKHIGMSPNTVNLTLSDLRDHHVLRYKRIGKTHAYSTDKNSAIFPILRRSFKEERGLRNDLIKTIKNHSTKAISVILFGSYARGEDTSESDLDLLIITDNKKDAGREITELGDELTTKFGIHLSPIIITPKTLKKKWNAAFMKDVRQYGVLIYGNGLGELHS